MFTKFKLGNLSIGAKLALMVLAPIIVSIYFIIVNFSAEQQVVTEARNIQEIVDLSVEIGNFIHASQAERGRTVTFVAGEGEIFANELLAQRAQTDAQIGLLRQTINTLDPARFGAEFEARLAAAIAELDQLNSFRNEVDRLNVSSDEAAAFYTNLDDQFLDVIGFIPTLTSNGQIVRLAGGYAQFLRLKDRVGLERAILSRAFTTDAFAPGELEQFIRVVAEREALTEAFLTSVPQDQIDIFNSTVQGATIAEVDRLTQIAFDKADEGDFGVNPDDWFTISTAKLNLFKQIEDVQANNLVTTAATLQQQAQTRLTLVNIVSIAGIVIAVVAAFVVSRGIIGQINNITDLFSRVGIGDFGARAKVTSNDQLGQMTTNLNAMLDSLLGLIQTQAERDQIQAAIMKLLDDVSGVAEGDLTREAEVTAEMTGAIADSFNFMISQLREIIANVQDATIQVSTSANEIRSTAEFLSQGSETQTTQIIDTAAAVDEMSVSIQQVSENATRSAEVAEWALINAQQGAQVVQETIAGMGRIREQVEETAKRIARLGESSQQIGNIVQVIGDIADRTSILALNASIQAAMAGEAGKGFAVVAEEVERLAERATEATRQIAGIVKTIQSETGETVTAMEESQREVIEGSHLADHAGHALNEIESVSQQLANLINSISEAAKQQARGSEVIAQSMHDIAEVTQQTAAGTKLTAGSISNLATLADNLRGSVSTFKLPANGNGHRA